jgi:hypothetical protein
VKNPATSSDSKLFLLFSRTYKIISI